MDVLSHKKMDEETERLLRDHGSGLDPVLEERLKNVSTETLFSNYYGSAKIYQDSLARLTRTVASIKTRMELSLEHIRENVICAKQLELIMRRSKDVGDSTEKETKEILQAIKLAEKLHEVEKEIEEKEATANRNRNRALFLGVVFAVVMPVVAVTYAATAAGATALTAATGGQILAILGGGTLASGGFGMAGGAAVLAGMVGTGAIITVGGSAKAGYDLFWARMGNK